MALGGWLGTLADPGGPRATRAETLLAFGFAGAPLLFASESVAHAPVAATLLLMAVAFTMSMARALGGTASGLGNYLTMVTAIGVSHLRTLPQDDAVLFAVGTVFALIASSIVWPVWTHLPIRRAVGSAYGELADYVDAIDVFTAEPPPPGDPRWTALVREHHRRIRAALEKARDAALAGRARRQGETRFGGTIRALIGAAELQFALVAALVTELESRAGRTAPADRQRLQRLARDARQVARALSRRDVGKRSTDPLIPSSGPAPPSTSVAEHLLDRLERADSLTIDLIDALPRHMDGSAPPLAPSPATRGRTSLMPARRPESLRPGVLASTAVRLRSFRDALSWTSPVVHHAIRTAGAVGAASVVGTVLTPSRAYWVTLTTLAVLQPYPGATAKRASERVMGTILGSLLALLLIATVRSTLVLAALLVPLSVAAVATRPRSYRLFAFFLTPVFVLVADRSHDWRTAALRAEDAVLGGAVAWMAGVLIAPSSERRRLPESLSAMLTALGTYAALVLGQSGHSGDRSEAAAERMTASRRATGVAIGAAETALERLLAEPLGDRTYAAGAMLLVTYSRRLGTALTSLAAVTTMPGASALNGEERRVRFARAADYVNDVLLAAQAFALETGCVSAPSAPPVGALDEIAIQALERVLRWTALIAGTLDQNAPERVFPCDPGYAANRRPPDKGIYDRSAEKSKG
jgi:uncharacterized membrane protein YccC